MAGSWREWMKFTGDVEQSPPCSAVIGFMIIAALGGLVAACCCLGAAVAWWPGG